MLCLASPSISRFACPTPHKQTKAAARTHTHQPPPPHSPCTAARTTRIQGGWAATATAFGWKQQQQQSNLLGIDPSHHRHHIISRRRHLTPLPIRSSSSMSSSSPSTSTTPNASSSLSPSITGGNGSSAGFFPPDVVHAAKDVLSSIVGSAMCVYTGQPFDTVKVRMQARPDSFMSPVQCFMTTFREEGLRALWKGSVPALVGAVSENAVAFSVNQQLKRIIADMDGYGFGGEGGGGGGGGGGAAETAEESLIVPFLTGGFTGIFTSAALCPSDVIKCKVQVSRAMLKTGETAMDAKEMLAHVLKQQGVKGLFVGLGAQFARDIPFYAFFFGTYELSLRTLKTHTTVPQEAAYLVAGGLAGVAGWAAIMPIDMAKSIIQTSPKPKGLIPTMLEVTRARGPLALYSGLGVAVFRAFPANAALFLGYELAREILD